MLAASLRRGLLAGALAGLAAGLFALAVGEGPVAEAIRIEQQAAAPAAGDSGFAVSRPAQQALLPVATGLVGVAVGGLYGLAWAGLRRRLHARSDWTASLRLGVVTWLAVSLLPSLKYPGNPPAVGDPATVTARSAWFLAAVAGGALLACGVWLLARRLRRLGWQPVPRQVAAGAAAAAGAGLLLVALPANTDPVAIPADLLWRFRLASLGTQLVLWGGLAVAFGLLAERAPTSHPPAARTARTGAP